MNLSLGLVQLVRMLSSALASGQAPSYWQQQLVNSTTGLQTLTQTTTWLNQLMTIDLHLNHQPLFGRQFTRLAQLNPDVSRSESEPSVSSPNSNQWTTISKGRSTTSIPSLIDPYLSSRSHFRLLKHSLDQSGLNARSDSAQQLATLSQLSQRASRMLLDRLATEKKSVSEPVSSLSQMSASRKPRQILATLAHSQSHLKALGETIPVTQGNRPFQRPLVVVSHSKQGSRSWLDSQQSSSQQNGLQRLSHRVQDSIHSFGPNSRIYPLSVAHLSVRRQMSLPVLKESETPEFIVENRQPLFAEPGKIHLDGLTVSTGFLLRLVSQSESRENHHSQRTASTPSQVSRSPTPAPTVTPVMPEPREQFPDPELNQTTRNAELLTSSAPSIALMRLSSVPSLNVVPNQETSVAAMIHTHAGTIASDVSEDELNLLSAKIKRILDEDARRHGIDV